MSFIEELADGFAAIERHPLSVTYMQAALKHVREWGAVPEARDDVRQFLSETVNVPEEAIVVLTPSTVTLLVNDDGNLLSFA